MILVDREGALDTLTIQVEIRNEAFSDRVEDMISLKRRIESEIKKYLNIGANVELKDQGSLPRFEGKAKRVVDRRIMT
jgi:phenylacetate-CoA ligase